MEITDTIVAIKNKNTIRVFFFEEAFMDVEQAQEYIRILDKLMKTRKVKLMAILNDYAQFSVDAVKYITLELARRKHQIIAEAIVFISKPNQLIEKIYMYSNIRHYQIRSFNDLQDATYWLEQEGKSTRKHKELLKIYN